MESLFAFGIVAAMTVTPLPLPPSWLVPAYLSLELDVHPVGIVVAAAPAPPSGRIDLAAWTRVLGPRLMGPGARANVDYLAERLRGGRGGSGRACWPSPRRRRAPCTPRPACCA